MCLFLTSYIIVVHLLWIMSTTHFVFKCTLGGFFFSSEKDFSNMNRCVGGCRERLSTAYLWNSITIKLFVNENCRKLETRLRSACIKTQFKDAMTMLNIKTKKIEWSKAYICKTWNNVLSRNNCWCFILAEQKRKIDQVTVPHPKIPFICNKSFSLKTIIKFYWLQFALYFSR